MSIWLYAGMSAISLILFGAKKWCVLLHHQILDFTCEADIFIIKHSGLGWLW